MWVLNEAEQLASSDSEFKYSGRGVGFVRASQGLTKEHPYFEVVFVESQNPIPNFSIGLSGTAFGGGGMVGQVAQSLGFCNKDGTLCFGEGMGVPVSLAMADKVRTGDKIGCGVLFEQDVAKAIYFMRNGTMLARCALLEAESTRLHPVVASSEQAVVKLHMQAESPLEAGHREDMRWACTVNKNRRALNVETALQKLGQGDAIEVHAGVHVLRNNITIGTACILTGVSKSSSKPTVMGTNGDLFTIDSGDHHVTIRSLCIKSFDKRNEVTQGLQRPRACILLKSGNISVELCDLHSCGAAFLQNDNKSIRQVKISSCTIKNIDKLRYGIFLGESSGTALIDSCKIDGSVAGIVCGKRSQVSIQNGCEITTCGTGIQAKYVQQVEVDACTLSRCQVAGIQHDTEHSTGQEDSKVIVRGGTIEYCRNALNVLGARSRIYYDGKVKFVESPLPDCPNQIKSLDTQGTPQPAILNVSGATFSSIRGHSVMDVYRILNRCGASFAAREVLENQTDGDTFVLLTYRQLRKLGLEEVSTCATREIARRFLCQYMCNARNCPQVSVPVHVQLAKLPAGFCVLSLFTNVPRVQESIHVCMERNLFGSLFHLFRLYNSTSHMKDNMHIIYIIK
jgi:hypothetical protein